MSDKPKLSFEEAVMAILRLVVAHCGITDEAVNIHLQKTAEAKTSEGDAPQALQPFNEPKPEVTSG